MNYQERLLKVIPGGAHTYSRGFDQFPSNAPQILQRAKGAYVYDPDGNEFLDYGMALLAVTIGYSEQRVNLAAIEQIEMGNNLTRPSLVELEAAECFVENFDSTDMVKFTKNGSTATTAAIKLSRAFTGRKLIARCSQHPFFSYDDWFIGSTQVPRGVPQEIVDQTKFFGYNDLEGFQRLLQEYPDELACVILEPVTDVEPKERFLHQLQDLCQKHGVVFILDEMKTGFRFHKSGAQHYFDLKPDLSCFGKGMANGFAVAAVAGCREIMELGSIESEGQERVFLLSTTHGAEMSSLGAFVEVMKIYDELKVCDHLWSYGKKLQDSMNEIARTHGIEHYFQGTGYACRPEYITRGQDGNPCLKFRTLFLQEMVRNGVLIPWVALCLRHGDLELQRTSEALDASLKIYAQALETGVERFLEGPPIKPVFRRFN